jgi:hypothetical protein
LCYLGLSEVVLLERECTVPRSAEVAHIFEVLHCNNEHVAHLIILIAFDLLTIIIFALVFHADLLEDIVSYDHIDILSEKL